MARLQRGCPAGSPAVDAEKPAGAADTYIGILRMRHLSSSGLWVFAGGLTSVRVELRVTDTQKGQTRTYVNPQGAAFQPIQDTSAFSTCP